ncbi:hypothetical protein ACSBR2_028795 [Camellia fascicularis]
MYSSKQQLATTNTKQSIGDWRPSTTYACQRGTLYALKNLLDHLHFTISFLIHPKFMGVVDFHSMSSSICMIKSASSYKPRCCSFERNQSGVTCMASTIPI